MAIIYDSSKVKGTPCPETKYFEVILDDRRKLIITGTSRRNVNKQLDAMIEEGDAFHKRVIEEIKIEE